jgi:cation diffusion facilitator CzcD-associated flavoprotein CzcO
MELSRGKRLVVVGYSKSAHDVVTAGSETAASTYLLFREAKWKMPRYIRGINVKYIILSRFGEALIKPEQHNFTERLIYKTGLAKTMLAGMEKYISRQQKLKETGLHPTASIKDQAFGEVTLETPRFFERVHQGRIIAKQTELASLQGKQITLTNGEQLECDMIVFATGFRQTIPFLPGHFIKNLIDGQGNYHLYRHILPIGVPALAFVGYNTSIQSPISAEFGALWLCEYLKGRVTVPPQQQMREATEAFLKWRSQFRLKGSSSGLSTMPGTIHHVDMLLKDMRAPMPFFSLIPDWLLTINPSRYRQLRRKIVKRNIGQRENTGRRMEDIKGDIN